MTDGEWLAATEPARMLEHLRGKTSDRKLRLFAVACCRRIWHLLRHDWSKEAVEVAEMNEDGLVDALVVEGRADQSEQAIGRVALRSQVEEYAATAAAWAVTFDPDRRCRAFEPAAVAAGMATGTGDWTFGRDREFTRQCELLRCLFGNPFRMVTFDRSWRTSTVLSLAGGIYEDRAFDRLPILADALQDAGCEDPEILAHCRGPGPHARGCFVVDLLLGKG